MGTMALNKRLVDNYFRFLKNLDVDSKKKLIIRLTESIELKGKKDNPDKLYGSWKDSRSAEEIIKDLENDRTNSREIEKI